MIKNQNNVGNKLGVYLTVVVIFMLIFSFSGTSCATANTSDPYIYNIYDTGQLTYDERQTVKIEFDALKKRVRKNFLNIPLLGISFMSSSVYIISMISPLFFEKDLLKTKDISGAAIEKSYLPVSIQEVDKIPEFQSVHLSNEASLSGRICFTGFVKDDSGLKNIKVVVRTPAGSRFEVLSKPVSGCSIDLSGFCIEGICGLDTVKEGDYEIVLAAKDGANQIISKTFFITVPSVPGCQQDLPGGQCVNYVRNFFGGRHDLMPGLCIYEDCGAYHAWEAWDLGYGKGRMPANKSILVLDKGRLLFGHMAVVIDHKRNVDDTYTLTVNESNWDRDELIDCNIRYTYFPETSKIIREGRKKSYDVAGFIYSENVHSQKDIPPEYKNATLPHSVTYSPVQVNSAN